jgi:hypothetical protein
MARARPVEVVDTSFGARAVARAFESIANDVSQRNDEEARAWSSNALSKARLDWTTQLLDRQSNAQPGAPDFTPAVIKDFDDYATKTIETAPTRAAKQFLHERLSALRTDIGEKAAVFEAQARIDYRTDQFTTSIDTTSKLMNTDPSQYAPALAEQLAIIDASAMLPIKKSAMRQLAVEKVSSAAVWSQVQKSPSAFLESIGFGPEIPGKARKSSGDLTGITGNTAFDALPFEKRTQLFEGAIRLKAQIDGDADKAVKAASAKLAEDAMKEAWNRLNSGKLSKSYIEQIRPLLSAPEYHSLLTATKEGGGQRTDPGTFRRLQELMYSNPKEAETFAFTAHKNGLLSNENLSSALSRSRELDRSGGPKSEYERSRNFIRGSLDPGPMVNDPVNRSRLAEALDTFDRWVDAGQGKRTDSEIQKRGQEVIEQYRFINLSDTVLALPSPRSGQIRRNPADKTGITTDILSAHRKAQADFEAGRMSKADYDQEMNILNRWRKAAQGK